MSISHNMSIVLVSKATYTRVDSNASEWDQVSESSAMRQNKRTQQTMKDISQSVGDDDVGKYIESRFTKLQPSRAQDWTEKDPEALQKIPAALLYMEVLSLL